MVNTGKKFKEAVFRFTQKMILEEEFPCFDEFPLHQIYKGKGKKDELSNNSYIHSKEWLSRLTEGLVVDNMKEKIPIPDWRPAWTPASRTYISCEKYNCQVHEGG